VPPPPPNLLTNGDFSSGTTGWAYYPQTSYGGGTGTLTNVSGKGRVSSPGSFVAFGQAIATVIGQTYTLEGDATNVDAALVFLRKSDDDQISSRVVACMSGSAAIGASVSFTATATTSHITIQTNGGVADFDNLRLH
jgi:hypothetical protein